MDEKFNEETDGEPQKEYPQADFNLHQSPMERWEDRPDVLSGPPVYHPTPSIGVYIASRVTFVMVVFIILTILLGLMVGALKGLLWVLAL